MNTDPVEIGWTLLAVSGLLYSAVTLWDYYRDLTLVLDFGLEGDDRQTVKETVRRELIRWIVQSLMTFAGVMAMFRPSTGNPYDPSRIAIVAALMLMSGLHVLNTHLDHRAVRRRRERAGRAKGFEERTADAFARIDQADVDARKDRQQVAVDLAASQGRADATEGEAGEAADAASKSAKRED